MSNYVYFIIFLFITICILARAISYGVYEIKQKNNKSGGITVISFSSVIIVLANILMFIRL